MAATQHRSSRPRGSAARGLAVAACFFVNAVLYANLVPRFPEVKASLGLSNTALGAALAALPLGALLAGLSSAPLIRRFGSARVASAGLFLLAVAVWAAAAAPNWPLLAARAAARRRARRHRRRRPERARPARPAALRPLDPQRVPRHLEHRRGHRRPASGRPPPASSVPLPVHLGRRRASLFGVPALFGSRAMLPGPDDAERDAAGADAARGRRRAVPAPGRPPRHGRPRASSRPAARSSRTPARRGARCTSATSCRAGAGRRRAGLRRPATAMTIGRLTGDRVVDRFGQRRVARAGGALTAAGMGFALAVPSIPTTLLGFALAGLGVATLVPAVYHAADELPGLPRGLGLAVGELAAAHRLPACRRCSSASSPTPSASASRC